jgi:pimeloyl-ACP methyl ester carboxylesterase
MRPIQAPDLSAMKRATKMLGLLACVTLTTVTACGDGDGADSTPAPPTTAGSVSAAPSTSPAGTAVATTSTPTTAAIVSLDERVAVGADGHELAIRCWGEGNPIVVLEAGHPDAGIANFSGQPVVDAIARENQVCTYDRAGEGISGPAPPGPRDADDVIADLHDLLAAADLASPYVLVGASFGGMIVTHYAATHPDDVAGVVLLDVPAPAVLDPAELPELVWDHPSNTEHLDIIDGFEGRFARARSPFPAPMIVITATRSASDMHDQAIWLELSPAAEQIELDGGHDIWFDNPEEVAAQILTLVRT